MALAQVGKTKMWAGANMFDWAVPSSLRHGFPRGPGHNHRRRRRHSAVWDASGELHHLLPTLMSVEGLALLGLHGLLGVGQAIVALALT